MFTLRIHLNERHCFALGFFAVLVLLLWHRGSDPTPPARTPKAQTPDAEIPPPHVVGGLAKQTQQAAQGAAQGA